MSYIHLFVLLMSLLLVSRPNHANLVHLKNGDVLNGKLIRVNENEPGDKQGQFFKRTKDGKQILRDVMRNYIPNAITEAEKQGFSAPDASWFKGQSIDFVKRSLVDSAAPIHDYMDRETLTKLIYQHLKGEKNRRLLIWSVLNFNAWLTQLGGCGATSD